MAYVLNNSDQTMHGSSVLNNKEDKELMSHHRLDIAVLPNLPNQSTKTVPFVVVCI